MEIFQRNCTDSCRSRNHGDLIISAITKCEVSDNEICSYLNYICSNCETVRDSKGRTALHLAASCGRLDLLRWLLKIKNTDVDLKDNESGYTALHRALFYGKINTAVELIKQGAILTNLDFDYMTPIQHVLRDGVLPTLSFGTVYYWGLNNNNSLGSFSSKKTPESLDIFHKRYTNTTVKQICLNKFHSVIVNTEGEVFACGYGLGGRLGLGIEHSIVEPQKIQFHSSEKIYVDSASISEDHCLFLTRDNCVFSCGSNKHRVLGFNPPPDKLLYPQKINIGSNKIVGVSAGKYHSVAWSNSSIFTWGLNAGQLGHDLINEKFHVCLPKLVKTINTSDLIIQNVASSDGATAVLTNKGDVYVIHEYQNRKITSKMLNARNIVITGGKLNPLDKDMNPEYFKDLIVVIQTNVGDLYIWQESDPYLFRCIFSIPRTIIVKNVNINSNEILFTTNFGEAYKAIIKPRKKKLLVERKNAYLAKNESITLKLDKIPRIYRGIFITSDPKGENYCIIQQNPYLKIEFPEIENKHKLGNHLKKLLNDSNEDDNVHDIQMKIDGKIFYLHKYILAHRCSKIFDENNEICLNDIKKEFFEEMLDFIYTGTCQLLEVGKCPEKFFLFNQSQKNVKNPLVILQVLSERFGCEELCKRLHFYSIQDDVIILKNSNQKKLKLTYKVSSFPEFHDVVLKCKDNKQIKAHKCILASRLEYFKNMFSARWNTGNVINISYSTKIVEALLEYLYTDNFDFLSDKTFDFLLNLFVLSDEYLVNDLKNHCSLLLLSSLNLKNAVELLQFSYCYKAEYLKEAVMKFIVNNIAYYLEIQGLNELNDDILNDLTQFYSEERGIFSRIITPYSTVISDETIDEFLQKNPATREIFNVKISPNKYMKKKKKIKSTNGYKTEKSQNIEKNESISFHDSTNDEELKSEQSITDCNVFNESINESLNSFEDFPLLNSPVEKTNHFLKKKFLDGVCNENNHKMVRLSQKERKRLSSSENKESPSNEILKNPWNKNESENISTISSPLNQTDFHDILLSQKKQKGNLWKLMNKQLKHTQLEDEAILELEKFYSIDYVEDEIIVVQRVEIGSVAAPFWIPKNQARGIHSSLK